MSRKRSIRSATNSKRWVALSLLALAASASTASVQARNANTIDPSSSSSGLAKPTLDPTSSISQAIAKSHKPWLVSAKDRVFNTVASFLTVALPDPRYFSFDLDQFDDMQDGSSSESGIIGDGGAGLNWGGSTLEVVRSQAIFLTRSAAFGPRITSDEGLRGFLLPISDFYDLPKGEQGDPMQACPYKGGPGWKHEDSLSKYEDEDDRRLYSGLLKYQNQANSQAAWSHIYNESEPKPPQDWIALVERGGGCGFAAKVRVAQDLGAVAVVVGDAPNPNWHGGKNGDPNEEGDPGLSGKRLVTMFAPGDTSDIRIPSTFVTRPSFLDLERLIDETEKDEEQWDKEHSDKKKKHAGSRGLEIVIGKDDLVWEWPLIDLGILLLLLPSFMTVVTIIVHRIRLIRQRRKERAPELVVLGLPCLIWRSNGQPWEKIEGPDADPGPGNGGSAQDGSSNSSDTHLISPGDLESGQAGAETIPLLQEDENGAGPSSQRSSKGGGSTRTVKIPAPPATSTSSASHRKSLQQPFSFLPPGRTYFSTDECAICLCDFVDGDRVRVLPCGHIFHRQEIDDWLVRVKKLCPICKRDITVPIPPAPPVATPSSAAAAAAAAAGAAASTGTLISPLELQDEVGAADANNADDAGDRSQDTLQTGIPTNDSQDLTQHLSPAYNEDDERSSLRQV